MIHKMGMIVLPFSLLNLLALTQATSKHWLTVDFTGLQDADF